MPSDPGALGRPSPAPDAASTPFGAYPFWHFEDTVGTMTVMAGGQANLEAGFQSASDLAAYTVHLMAAQPTVTLEPREGEPPVRGADVLVVGRTKTARHAVGLVRVIRVSVSRVVCVAMAGDVVGSGAHRGSGSLNEYRLKTEV